MHEIVAGYPITRSTECKQVRVSNAAEETSERTAERAEHAEHAEHAGKWLTLSCGRSPYYQPRAEYR